MTDQLTIKNILDEEMADISPKKRAEVDKKVDFNHELLFHLSETCGIISLDGQIDTNDQEKVGSIRQAINRVVSEYYR
ncbi:hypothetical protein KJ632_04695 [Patescibacteria group bacterium]|nr:hypothetical protein [Patescibacteria group bacterium]